MLKRFFFSCVFVFCALAMGYWLYPQPQIIEHKRFVKVTQQAKTLEPWQGPWACVFDKETSLLWEVKRDDESIHDGYWSYSWFDGSNGTANLGDCYFEPTRCDTLDLVRRANQTKLCQVTGWRLPTAIELQSILQHQDQPKQPKLATDYFRHIKAGDYWTQDSDQALSGHYRHLGKGATAVDFYLGRFHSLPYRNAAFVMLVTTQIPSTLSEESANHK